MPLNPPWLLAAASAAAVSAAAPAAARTHHFHADHVLGVSLDVVVAGADEAAADRAVEAARAEIDRLDALLSGWRPDSELARLNAAAGPMVVSAELFEVIAACEACRSACGGAFSGRLGAVEALWRAAEAAGEVPSQDALAQAAAAAEAAEVVLDPARLSITRPPGVVFAVDALAKGYIVDRAMTAARAAAPEAAGMLVDIGGDLRCWGEGPAGAWRIGVAAGCDPDNAEPVQALALRDKAVATSGPGPRDRAIGGERFSHLLSPPSGRPVGSTVTVTADRAADADAFATALAALEPSKALAAAEARPGFEARIVGGDGRAAATSGWSDLVYRPGAAPGLIRAAAAPAAAGWPAGFQVKVDLTILPGRGHGAHFWPFVVVWVSDPQGKLVRTVALWGDKRSYVGENRIWWRSFLAKYKYNDMDRFTRPSRGPGSYSVVWDGKDEDGATVAPGPYVVHVEFVREDGPRAHQTMALTVGPQPAVVTAPADEELGPSTMRYGRPAPAAPAARPRAPAR